MRKIFVRGLVALAPIAITLAILIWLFKSLESFFGGAVERIVGPHYYFPGLGLLIALIVIFFAGLFFNNFIVQKASAMTERLFKKIPLVKTLYSSLVDLMGFFQKSDSERQEGHVVRVNTAAGAVVGILTREDFKGLPEGLSQHDEVAVYIPMSYQLGGFTIMVRKSAITPLDMSVEEGMRFVVTAGALKKKELK